MNATILHFPSETDLLEAATKAEAAHLFLITDGKETLLSPICPPGFFKLAVRVKPGSPAEVKAAA